MRKNRNMLFLASSVAFARCKMDSNTQFLDQLEQMGGGGKDSAPTEAEEDKIQYTSHPIKNYRVGRFSFENALLTLRDADEEAELLQIIDDPKFPERERHMIRKLDMSAAERISRDYRKQGGATKQFDSSVGERADSSPKTGVGDLLGTHKRREELGLEAAAEGGREQKVPGAPDSNRETQTEPSPQMPPETPFRAEEQGRGGAGSAEDIVEELESDGKVAEQAEQTLEDLGRGKPADNEEAPAVEAAEERKPAETSGIRPDGFGKPLLSGLPKKD